MNNRAEKCRILAEYFREIAQPQWLEAAEWLEGLAQDFELGRIKMQQMKQPSLAANAPVTANGASTRGSATVGGGCLKLKGEMAVVSPVSKRALDDGSQPLATVIPQH